MQANSDYTLLSPSAIEWNAFRALPASEPFADETIEYLNALSASLLKDSQTRQYPDVVTFAFFCRKANLAKLKEFYGNGSAIRLGRGIVFHIAPGNVPVNFAYTLVAGMLAGNNNIVRVSSKDFPQVDLIVAHMLKLASDERWSDISRKNALVRYDHQSDATAFFSSFADVRVIWGGNETIKRIREAPLPPRSFDICFAERYSICAINPDAIMAADDAEMQSLANNFYNDTYLFDQNACSAPHVVFWKESESLVVAKEKFWEAIHKLASQKYNLQPVQGIDKRTALHRLSIETDAHEVPMPDNYIVRAELKKLPQNIDDYRCTGGFFAEHTIKSLDEIAPIVTRKYQTLAYYGFEHAKLESFVKQNRLSGIDRIVPIGRTTEFSLTWDGYNLIEAMSRIVDVI